MVLQLLAHPDSSRGPQLCVILGAPMPILAGLYQKPSTMGQTLLTPIKSVAMHMQLDDYCAKYVLCEKSLFDQSVSSRLYESTFPNKTVLISR
jgi:hypothetical protein